jgi:deazaflavin-dependent oxidoreductase (nitroreductase family)
MPHVPEARTLRTRFLWTLKHTLNRVTTRAARSGRGPFSLIRHVGRRSGREYETPVILAQVPDGFVAELTYGPDVDWYRNVVAAGGCTVIHHGREYAVDRISTLPPEEGLAAYPYPQRLVLRLLRRHQFRLLAVPGDG